MDSLEPYKKQLLLFFKSYPKEKAERMAKNYLNLVTGNYYRNEKPTRNPDNYKYLTHEKAKLPVGYRKRVEILRFLALRGTAATIQEIANSTGIRTCIVNAHLDLLISENYLQKEGDEYFIKQNPHLYTTAGGEKC